MAVLNESGIPDVLPPLCGLRALAERLPDALVVVAGTQAEAHLVHSVPDALSRRRPSPRGASRVVSILLDPEEPPEQGRIASEVIEAAAGYRDLQFVLLVVGRTAHQIGIDEGFETRMASRRLDLPVTAVSAGPSSSRTFCTDLEDRTLAALVDLCPSEVPEIEEPEPERARGGLFGGLFGREKSKPREPRRRPVAILGATRGAQGRLASELADAGVEVSGYVPELDLAELPGVGEGAVVGVAAPYLSAAARQAEERGATVVRTQTPVGIDGTARFLRDVASEAGHGTSGAARARTAWEELEPLRNRIRGKRFFFAGDTGLEIPVARFLLEAGAVVLEVGAPKLDRRLFGTDVQALSAHVDVIESPDPRGQLERIDKARPDVVVASPGLYAPLVARGHLCRSSPDFLGADIYGYEGARRILELFVRAFERAEALDSVKL